MIANHPIYGHKYSYHIRGDRSPLNENEYLDAGWVQEHLHLFVVIGSHDSQSPHIRKHLYPIL